MNHTFGEDFVRMELIYCEIFSKDKLIQHC
jgi:hypothetical protein